MKTNKVFIENLLPGNLGKDCLYNGENSFECACNECDFLVCCIDKSYPNSCWSCYVLTCPRRNLEELIKILKSIKTL